MHKLLTITSIALLSVLLLPGCSSTKVDYSKNDKGEINYSISRKGHWLNSEVEQMSGGMSQDGRFSIGLQGYKTSPSEEFNKSMQTYMGAIISAMQIAAAAYNPSASAAIQSAALKSAATTNETSSASESTSASAQPSQSSQSSQLSPSTSTDCKDGSCTDTAACPDGSCNPPPVTQPAAESATK